MTISLGLPGRSRVSTIASDNIRWSFSDPNGGVVIEAHEKDNSLYVVMPMRL